MSKLRRDDSRVILHFDYDCFYASVVEHENPALKSLPLAIQQKQIVVTCNYEARRRVLKEAKKICPDLVVVLGEDLTKFRDASKLLYGIVQEFSWGHKAERLGLDEVFLDVTEAIDYNVELITTDLANAWFHLDPSDPMKGFGFDASRVAGHTFGEVHDLRLITASHLALHIRKLLDGQHGFTCTVGISTNKTLAKLAGSTHKPDKQTTISPKDAINFMDGFEIGRVPGIGFKISYQLRNFILGRQAKVDDGLIYGAPIDKVMLRDVRLKTSPEILTKILAGPGASHDIGLRVWQLMHGIDNAPVLAASKTPKQISIEDSYLTLSKIEEVYRQLQLLSESLIKRMRIDLLEDGRWIGHPKTLRLQTRAWPPPNPDGSRGRGFSMARQSRSEPMPSLVFSQNETIPEVAQKLVAQNLIPLFKKLHPEQSGWDLGLVNVAAVNIMTAKTNDIGKMLRAQPDPEPELGPEPEPELQSSQELEFSEDELDGCEICGASVPEFARAAHTLYHELGD